MPHRTSIVFAAKDQVRVIEEPVPELQPGHLLVRTVRTVISTGTESIALGQQFAPGTHWAQYVKYPFRPGYLNAGRVIGVGAGVEGWAIGDRVASSAGHTSHALIDARGAVRIPEHVADEEAALTALGRVTQVGVRSARHTLGDSVVLIGAGLLGQMVVQYLDLLGARQVIVIDTAEKRLAMARAHGATHALLMTSSGALDEVRRITDGCLADVIYDITGVSAVLPTALPLARDHGTVVILGDTGTPGEQRITGDVIHRGLRLVGAHGRHAGAVGGDDAYLPYAPWNRRRFDELFLDYLARGKMRFADLITHRYRPEQAPEAYAMLQTDRDSAMIVVFDWPARD